MKQFITFFILFALLSCNDKKQLSSALTVDLTDDIVNPKHYIITKNKAPLVIDGIANEPAWQSASFSDSFIDIEGIKTPRFDTKFKMLWDENYFYVYTQMQEPHIWGDLKQRDTVIFFNNDIEVFFDPSGTTKNYAEIEINALGTVWDLILDKPYRVGGKANNFWNLEELKTGIQIHGTLNNHTDIDSFWTVEMAIPLKALITLKSKPRIPEEGEQWRVNFDRVEWEHDIINGSYQRKKENGKYLKESNWVWSNQKVINMHQPEKWGIIQFTHESESKKVKFKEDKNSFTKQTAYALFRHTRFGSLKEHLNNNVGHTQEFKVAFSDKDSLDATLYITNFGFEYKIKAPESDQIFIINEEGVLKTL